MEVVRLGRATATPRDVADHAGLGNQFRCWSNQHHQNDLHPASYGRGAPTLTQQTANFRMSSRIPSIVPELRHHGRSDSQYCATNVLTGRFHLPGASCAIPRPAPAQRAGVARSDRRRKSARVPPSAVSPLGWRRHAADSGVALHVQAGLSRAPLGITVGRVITSSWQAITDGGTETASFHCRSRFLVRLPIWGPSLYGWTLGCRTTLPRSPGRGWIPGIAQAARDGVNPHRLQQCPEHGGANNEYTGTPKNAYKTDYNNLETTLWQPRPQTGGEERELKLIQFGI